MPIDRNLQCKRQDTHDGHLWKPSGRAGSWWCPGGIFVSAGDRLRARAAARGGKFNLPCPECPRNKPCRPPAPTCPHPWYAATPNEED